MRDLSSRRRETKLAENILEEIVIASFSKFSEKRKCTDSRISAIPQQDKYKITTHRHTLCAQKQQQRDNLESSQRTLTLFSEIQ